MDNVEYLLLLLIAAAVLVRLADAIHVPYPIVLVLGGLGIALAPGLPDIVLPPDAIFLLFLPPLVHAAGWSTSPQELRAVVRPLAELSVVLVLVTAAAVAVVAHALVPGVGWAPAFVLGAVLAPTDAVAATATFGRLGAPDRLRLVVEGESMINDGTALVLYRIAVGVAAGGSVSAGGAVLQFIGNTAGGVLVGLAVGFAVSWIIERQTDAALVIVITVLGAYGAYIAADRIHASGIIAAVVTGLVTGWRSPQVMDADTRLTSTSFWRVLVFGLEITLFVLLGLQLPTITHGLRDASLSVGELIGPAAAIAAALVAVRMAFVFALRDDAGENAAECFIAGWAGMRGAVSLAAALAIPLDVAGRPQLVFLTFAVMLLTLVGQGLTLPLLLRKLRLPDTRPWSDEEAAARMEAAQAALDRLDELEEEAELSESQLTRLRDIYRTRFRVCVAVLGGENPGAAQREQRVVDYSRRRRELIGVERDTLLELRSAGRLSNRALRQIQRDLDLEEARLRV
jgi:CPA1 family monovalent cation:H+ antiporter